MRVCYPSIASNDRSAGGGRLNALYIGSVLQYATLISLLIAGLGLAVASRQHRVQMKTQIFLAMSARYDDLLRSSSAEVWLHLPPDATLPEASRDLSISALRFCTLVSLTYYLYRDHQIPERMWKLMLQSAERRLRSPLFAREWSSLKYEFESFPEFVNLVNSVQRGRGETSPLRSMKWAVLYGLGRAS